MQVLSNRGTRLKIFTVLSLFVTVCYIWGVVSPNPALPNFDQWFSTIQWGFGIYALSEVGGKGAEAYRDRGTVKS